LKPSNAIKKQIQFFEGYRPKAYQDAAGIWTVGYGHTRTAEKYRGLTITYPEALALFETDINQAAALVDSWQALHRIRLTQSQYDALISFVFNVGYIPTSLTRRIKTGQGNSVSNIIKEYTHAGGVQLPGLIFRRQYEANLFNRTKNIFIVLLGSLVIFAMPQR